MEKVRRFLSVDDVYKNMVLKFVQGITAEEIETKFITGLMCPKCGQKGIMGTGALFYRNFKSNKWIQVGESLMCSKCRDSEVLKTIWRKV